MKIRIEAPKVDKPGPYSAHGTRIFLDDQELRDVGDVTVNYPVKGPVSVDFSMFATEELSLEANAEVHITIQAIPGYEIIACPSGDGVIRYSCVRSDLKINYRPNSEPGVALHRNIDPRHRSVDE